MNYPKVIGTYYLALGWLSLAWLGVALLSDSLTPDFSFFIWLLMGFGLRKASSTAKTWSIALAIAFGLLILMSYANGNGIVNVWMWKFQAPSLGYYLAPILTILIIVVPALLLLKSKAKEQFDSPASPVQPDCSC